MPIAPGESIDLMKEYIRDMVNDGPPAGSHQTQIMKKEGHPVSRYDKNTGELPELFFIAQVSDGQFERRTIPVTLKWFAPKIKSDFAGGGERTEKEMASLAGMYRSQTVAFFRGLWGKELEDRPVALPAKDDSLEEVYEVFKDIASVIGGLDVRCEVSYGKNPDFPNYKWAQVTGGSFSL